MCFKTHYNHPTLVWVVYSLGCIIPIATGSYAYRQSRWEEDFSYKKPMWYTFAALAFTVAVILAGILGELNFWYNMQPYYDMRGMNTYPSVDPARWKGQQVEDAGRVYFASGTELDPKRA